MITLKIENKFGAAMTRGIVLASALVAALALQAQESSLQPSKEHTSTKVDTASCLKEAAQMNTATIKFGQLASQKAQNPELKQFGEMLEKDHKKAQEKLEKVAKNHNVILPTSLDPKCQEEMTKLQALSGDEFDREFAKGAVQGHAMALKKFQEASLQAKESDVKEYAQDMVSGLKKHQEKSREIAKLVGLDQATIASLETTPPEGVGTPGESIERGTSSPQGSSEKEHKDSDKPSEP